MKRKYYILGILALLCLLGTGYYAWTLYDAYRKQVAEWNEGAKAAFEEALWMEVDKRAEVPMYHASSGEHGKRTLSERISDSVSVMTIEGFRRYKIDRKKYDNSLIKETDGRAMMGVLLGSYPLSIDSLSCHWDSILSEKQILVNSRIRYVYTDLELRNDTLYSFVGQQLFRLDSLTVKYLGFRCEHELTAYVSYSSWLWNLPFLGYFGILFPWSFISIIYCLLFFDRKVLSQ